MRTRELNRPSIRSPGALWFAVAMALSGCDGGTSERAPRVHGRPHYLEIYSLQTAADQSHSVSVNSTAAGGPYYREEAPGFCLGMSAAPRAEVYSSAAEGWEVVVWLEDDVRETLGLWSKPRQDKLCGVFVQGRLVFVSPMPQHWGAVVIKGVGGEDEAKRVAATINGE